MSLLMDSLLSLEGRLISLEKAVAEKQEPISEDWAAARLDEIVCRLGQLECKPTNVSESVPGPTVDGSILVYSPGQGKMVWLDQKQQEFLKVVNSYDELGENIQGLKKLFGIDC